MEKQDSQTQIVTTKGSWFAGYIVAGLIWVFAQGFRKTAIDEFIILVIAIGAGFFYRRLKRKIKIKNEAVKIIITFIIIEVIAGFLVGLLTALF